MYSHGDFRNSLGAFAQVQTWDLARIDEGSEEIGHVQYVFD